MKRNKILIGFVVIVSLMIALVACDNEKIDNGEIINNEQNNNQDKNQDNNVSKPDYSYFVLDAVHGREPGAFGSGMAETYYFASDNTFYWNISDYVKNEKIVAKYGTWQINEGKLKLIEQYNLVLENGELGLVSAPGGVEVEGYINYDIVVKESDKETEYDLTLVGLSSYAKEVLNREIPDTYKLNDETWYSDISTTFETMQWANCLKQKLNEKNF